MSGEDLRGILGLREDRFAVELAAHRLDEVGVQRALSRSRRARRVRSGAIAAVAAVAVTIAGVGVWALTGQQHRDPLVAPPSPTAVTVTASPTLTPTSSPSPTLEAPAFSTSVATGDGFLQASPMTAQLWHDVRDGWILSYWAPTVSYLDPYEAAVYLHDPDGARYEVSHFSEPGPWHVVSVGFWEPGADSAVAYAQEYADGVTHAQAWGTVNLISGEFTPLALLQDAVSSLGTAPDGSYLFSTGGVSKAGVLVVASDLSSSHEWTLNGDFGEGHLSPDGTAILDMPDGVEGSRAFTVRSSVDGTVLWDGSEASYGAQGHGQGVQDCTWNGWTGGSDLAIVCTWHAVDNYELNYQSDIYTAGAAGSKFVATMLSDLRFSNVQPAGDGVVGEGVVNVAGADSGEVFYVDRAGMIGWPYRREHGIWPTFMVAGNVEAVGWNEYGPGSASARNIATGAVFDVVPPWTDRANVTGSTFSFGVVLVGSPRAFQVSSL